jgi:hypothetical protein
MIIGINGYSNSGKDTIGTIIQELGPRQNWEIKKFAGKLKQIAEMLTGIDISMFEDQDFKKTNLPDEWRVHGMPMTYREFLQKLGTDAMREGLHDDVWVNALMADYKSLKMDQYYPSNWVITDVRFPNEARAIKKKEGMIIRVDRPGVKPINNHPSEIGLDHWNFDYKIGNASDLLALKASVEIILKENDLIYD